MKFYSIKRGINICVVPPKKESKPVDENLMKNNGVQVKKTPFFFFKLELSNFGTKCVL